MRIVSSLFYLPLLHCNKPLLTLLKTRYFMPLFPLIFLFPFLKTDLHQVFFRVNFDSFPWQILQCLSIQGLTSSGGGSGTAGGDGGTGSSSGASRAIVKDR